MNFMLATILTVFFFIFALTVMVYRTVNDTTFGAAGTSEPVSRLVSNNVRPYRYSRKQYLLTRAENECFHLLMEAVGKQYVVLAQVRLSGLLYEKIRGQSWRGALGRVNQKSVDFVLCDKENVSPKLAIELDDASHERADRKSRDGVVESILADAGLPLLRLRTNERLGVDEVVRRVQELALP